MSVVTSTLELFRRRPPEPAQVEFEATSEILSLRQLLSDTSDEREAARSELRSCQSQFAEAERKYNLGDPSVSDRHLSFHRRQMSLAQTEFSRIEKRIQIAWRLGCESIHSLRSDAKQDVQRLLGEYNRLREQYVDYLGRESSASRAFNQARDLGNPEFRKDAETKLKKSRAEKSKLEPELKRANERLIAAERERCRIDLWIVGADDSPVATVRQIPEGTEQQRCAQWLRSPLGPRALVPLDERGIEVAELFVAGAKSNPHFSVEEL